MYLLSLEEEQAGKWENCLEVQEQVKAIDTTCKVIKDRLLRAVIERSKKLGDLDNFQ